MIAFPFQNSLLALGPGCGCAVPLLGPTLLEGRAVSSTSRPAEEQSTGLMPEELLYIPSVEGLIVV